MVESDSLRIDVAPDPALGQPADFRGAAGGGLALRTNPLTLDMSVGDARTLAVSLEGRGNVALWPEPQIVWPEGLRAYPGEVQVSVQRDNGLIRGSKTFSYVLVADSAGVYHVPSPTYPYYDLDARRYIELRGARLDVVARPGTGPSVARATPPPLLAPRRPLLPPLTRAPLALWVALAAAPFAILALVRVRRTGRDAARHRGPAPEQEAEVGRLDVLERHFRRELEGLVPVAERYDGPGLADALRAAGVEAALAGHVARVRDRLRQAVYGKRGVSDPAELAAEVEAVRRALLGRQVPRGRAGPFARALVLGLLVLPVAARGQATPERLYAAGAVRAAADSFAARAAAEPDVAAYWYNLGDAQYELGADARAEAAWVRAARLAPRNPAVELALGLVPPGDPVTERLLWVGPLTPDEALALAVALWTIGWLIALRRRWRPAAVGVLVGALVAAGYGAVVWQRYHQSIALTLENETPLREAPYGGAAGPDRLREGTAVQVEAVRAGWLLVRYGDARGWVLRKEVVPL